MDKTTALIVTSAQSKAQAKVSFSALMREAWRVGVAYGSNENARSTWMTSVAIEQLAHTICEAAGVASRVLPKAELKGLWGESLPEFVDYQNRAASAKGAPRT